MRLLLSILLSTFLSHSFFAQRDEAKMSATLNSFLKKSAEMHKKFEAKKTIKNFSSLYAKVLLITYSEDSATLKSIYKDLAAQIHFETIVEKYKLEEFEDYYYDFFLFEPVFLKQYFNKILFHCFPVPNRFKNLAFENTEGYTSISDFKKGTRLIDTTDELLCIQFLDTFTHHPLPAFINKAMNYYETISGNSDILYYKLDRFITSYPPNIDSLNAKWEKFPGEPDEPQRPEHDTDKITREKYKKETKNFEKLNALYEKDRCNFFRKHYNNNPIDKENIKVFTNFSIENYLWFAPSEEQLSCIGITNRYPNQYFAPGYYKYSRTRHRKTVLESLEKQNYSTFSKSLVFYEVYKPETPLEIKLVATSKTFYKYPDLFYLGSLASTLLTNRSDVSYIQTSIQRIDNVKVRKKIITNVKEWLKTKPDDLLLVFLMGEYWLDFIDDCEECDEDKAKDEFKELMKPYPTMIKMLEEY